LDDMSRGAEDNRVAARAMHVDDSDWSVGASGHKFRDRLWAQEALKAFDISDVSKKTAVLDSKITVQPRFIFEIRAWFLEGNELARDPRDISAAAQLLQH
jgi:hypothetical protein